MVNFFKPDYSSDSSNPFARDENQKLVRRNFWLDMSDRSLILCMTVGVGSHIPNDLKKTHLADVGRSHLIDQICLQEILPPEN